VGSARNGHRSRLASPPAGDLVELEDEVPPDGGNTWPATTPIPVSFDPGDLPTRWLTTGIGLHRLQARCCNKRCEDGMEDAKSRLGGPRPEARLGTRVLCSDGTELRRFGYRMRRASNQSRPGSRQPCTQPPIPLLRPTATPHAKLPRSRSSRPPSDPSRARLIDRHGVTLQDLWTLHSSVVTGVTSCLVSALV